MDWDPRTTNPTTLPISKKQQQHILKIHITAQAIEDVLPKLSNPLTISPIIGMSSNRPKNQFLTVGDRDDNKDDDTDGANGNKDNGIKGINGSLMRLSFLLCLFLYSINV